MHDAGRVQDLAQPRNRASQREGRPAATAKASLLKLLRGQDGPTEPGVKSRQMADYSKWGEKLTPVTSLSLDPRNPRIPPTPVPLDQRALIAELVEHEKVLELAKDIVESGYSPVESLIGLEEESDSKTYILEGNRRLAALKLLLSPETAPEPSLKRVRRLSQEIDHSSIRKVRVLYAPSREAAAPLIMQKHTRQQIEKWSPVMQARFYRSLTNAGFTSTELVKRYGGTQSEVSEFLRLEAAYDLACRIDLPDSVKSKVHDPRKFPVSTLQRILDVAKARDALGIVFDENGAISGTVHPDEFGKGFARVLTDIASEKINTRTVNTQQDVEKYLTSIKDALPDKKRKGSFVATDFSEKAPVPAGRPVSAPRKAAAQPRQSASVIPFGVRCLVRNTRIKEIFGELKTLRLEKNPNASAVLFRILLELSIGHYLDKTKKIQPLLDAAKKKGRGDDWYPTLRQMLDAVLKDPTFVIVPLARKKLNKLISDQTSPLSVDGLDSYVHSRFSSATPRDLRHYWDTFEAIFEIVLNEPAKGPASPAMN